MWATALIVFRETLEAAVFLGIVAAAARGLPGRGRWLTAGVAAGLLGAVALAAGAAQISAWADGVGQDLVNVATLSLALTMLAWHCIWVSTQGREMAQDARRLGSSAHAGGRAPWALALAIALAVLREGAETVLFVAGLNAGVETSTLTLLSATATGLGSGALVGSLIYLGLSRVRPQHLFTVTQGLVLLLAASMASQLARSLLQAGLAERGGDTAWDSSAWLSNTSAPGTLLHALVGYDAQPSALQVLFYAGTLVALVAGTRGVRRWQRTAARAAPAVTAPARGTLAHR